MVCNLKESIQTMTALGLKWIGGKSLRCIAHIEGEWVALLGWSSASKKCGVVGRTGFRNWEQKSFRRHQNT
jgi:hypothetical protein